jgi:CubicO group peptidase (beta-lactamase class C family)
MVCPTIQGSSIATRRIFMDFAPVDAALQRWVDGEVLPGISYVVWRGDELLARRCIGWADREARVPLREDHLFRIFSNTKLFTSCAALQLVEQGRIGLDDPVAAYLPALANLRVLHPGARSMDDTEPAREPVRIRHLLTHTAGFTYAFLDPAAPIARAYVAAGMTDPTRDLAQMCEALGQLPLLFQPGTAWNYSVATDVIGRIVEVVSGQDLEAYFARHLFEPLGLQDTFFFVPEAKQARLATLYIGSLRQPLRPGLRRVDHLPYQGAYRQRGPHLSGGGGLVSSLDDCGALVRTLLRGGTPLLASATLPLVFDNQLAPGQWIGCTGLAGVAGCGHSFAASVTVHENPDDPASVQGELQWGGFAGTKWTISPRENLAMVLMTQRYVGSSLPVFPEFKQLVRAAIAG